MKLLDCARFFDKQICQDAYNPAYSFKGQFNLFNDSMRDGAIVTRKILSVAPGIAMPPRGVVGYGSEVWIVGAGHQDSFGAQPLRNSYVVEQSHGLADIRYPAQWLTGAPGIQAYSTNSWLKDKKESNVSSAQYGFYMLYFAQAETIDVGQVVQYGGNLFYTHNCINSSSGFLDVEAGQLDDNAFVDVSYSKRSTTYNPVTDSYTAAATLAIKGLWHRYRENFERLSPQVEKFAEGDIILEVAASAVTPAAGDTYTIGAVTWRVLNVTNDGHGTWLMHSRHA